MELYLPENHVSLNTSNDIKEICQPIFKQTKINCFLYCKCFDDGSLSVLITDPKWHKHFWQVGYQDCISERLEPGIHAWHDKDNLSSIDIDASKNFNRHNTVDIVTRKEDYYELISLATGEKELNAFEHYQQHLPYINGKFLLYFKEQANKLIKTIDDEENRIGWDMLKKANQPISLAKRLDLEVQRYYINEDCILTKLQMTCFLLYLVGHSAREISEILPKRSRKTIESYIEEIKFKTGCYSRPAMFHFARNYNLLHLIDEFDPNSNKFNT